MADIALTRSHAYPVEDARARLERLLVRFQAAKPDLIERIDWAADRNSAQAGGRYFKGQFRVTETAVSVELDLIGFAAKMAKGMVRARLEKTISEEFPG
ncbi:MAG: hypothetical protein EXR79_02740 [Myxococcales bacterium]|nr:hypothetical protein [Myxococcales bacterium]